MNEIATAAWPTTTRVWVYQAAQPFAEGDLPDIQQAIQNFAHEWVSHNRQLRATGQVLHQRFVVLMVDENQADASGCSIDKSVAFIRSLGAHFDRDLFDRMRFTYRDSDGALHTVSREEFAQLYASGQITDHTPVFDPLVNTLADLQTQFEKPLGKSWHRRMV